MLFYNVLTDNCQNLKLAILKQLFLKIEKCSDTNVVMVEMKFVTYKIIFYKLQIILTVSYLLYNSEDSCALSLHYL